MDDDPPTEELEALQREREAVERERARAVEDENATAQHARRADKAAYLREKLEDRAASERDADE
jgi:hypothetical protein